MEMMERLKPEFSIMTVTGCLVLAINSAIYAMFGLSAYPRQEWLIEVLMAIIFLIPVVNLMNTPGKVTPNVRVVGLTLILHSVWDALHWPGNAAVMTPIFPWIPKLGPFVVIPLGLHLVLRGR